MGAPDESPAVKTLCCPQCKAPIEPADVDVARDVVYCRRCNVTGSLAEFVHGAGGPVDLGNPPPGTWRSSGPDGTIYGASHRSWGAVLGTLAISLFWNGIVSVFIAIALSGTLHLLAITPPVWFPAPVMNKQPMSLGVVLFLWLFLTPFIVIGAGMIIAFVSALFGRTELRVRGDGVELWVGAGPLGWTRRFARSEVDSVELGFRSMNQRNAEPQKEIHVVLRNGKKVKFGSSMPEERRRYLLAATRQVVRGG